MLKKIETLTIAIICVFIFFCAIKIGHSWDLGMEVDRGNQRLKYVLFQSSFESYTSLSRNIGDEFYPGFYTTLTSFITKFFPKKFEFEIWQLTNSLFAIFTVFGIYRISKIFFNKQVAKIIFLLCILNPIFFGHMAMNPKDIPIAFANVWSTYIFLKYIQNQNKKRDKYILLAGLAIGFGTGMRIPFIITLFPIFIFVLVDVFFLRKISNQNFSIKKFILHLLIVLLIAYIVTISCWPHVHGNIFTEPFKIASSINKFPLFGLPWILLNGNFYDNDNLPTFYIFINLFYKSPEFIILCYVIIIYILIYDKDFFLSRFNFLQGKILLILTILVFPTILFMVYPYKVYDGLRLFLYLIPFFCLLPGLAIYYLIYNYKILTNKILLALIVCFFVYFVAVFIKLTPYQYTYLNLFAGNFSNVHKKFENDYWAVSIKELIKKISKESSLLSAQSKINLAYCGLPHSLVKKELRKIKKLNYQVVDPNDESVDYILMTNRIYKTKEGNLKTCFNNFVGQDIVYVKRNGLILSTLRKIKNK